MKTRSMIAALAFAFAGTAAFAQSGEATYEYPQPAVSAKSRADVKAELLQARAAGLVQIGEAGVPQVPFIAQRTRAEVRAETLAAVASGELRHLNHEPYSANGAFVPARTLVAPVVTAAK